MDEPEPAQPASVPGALIASHRAQIWPEPANESLIGPHLERRYGGRVVRVSALDAGVFAIDWSDGRHDIARVFPAARPLGDAEGDAAILRYLEAHDFPAERCACAEAVSLVEGRPVLLTTRVDGEGGRPSRGVRLFRALGDLLGRLQTMDATTTGALGRPAGSWHHLSFAGGGRRQDINLLERLLADAQATANDQDAASYGVLRDRVGRLDDCEDLPQSLIHPDFSTPNVVVSPTIGPVIVDWTGAGRGARILALGTLLVCAGTDVKLVDAIVDGYGQHIRLEDEEIERLPGALRGFGLIIDSWAAVFRPKSLERIMQGRKAKWYVAHVAAARAQEQLRARSRA